MVFQSLYSLLGAQPGGFYQVNDGFNIDTIERNASVATTNSTLGTFPQDASKYGVLMQFAGTSYFAAQIYISANNYVFFRRRDDGVWGGWNHIDNFGCSTPAELASLLGSTVVSRDTSAPDLNGFDTTQYRVCTVKNAVNRPETGGGAIWGVVVNFGCDNEFVGIQLYLSQTGTPYIRVKWDGVWKSWVTLT